MGGGIGGDDVVAGRGVVDLIGAGVVGSGSELEIIGKKKEDWAVSARDDEVSM